MMRGGNLVAILYAISIILPGEEILWDYGICNDDDDDLSEDRSVPVSRRTPLATHTSDVYAPEHRTGPFSSRCLTASMGKDSFHPDYVILDCASGTNLCKSRKHARDTRLCVRGMITGIEGALGGTHYDESCTFVDPALGRMPLATGASANIISLAVPETKVSWPITATSSTSSP
jgi:hypothetical protein